MGNSEDRVATGASGITRGDSFSPDPAERRTHADTLYREARALRHRDYDSLKVLAEESLELACQAEEHGEAYPLGRARALSLLAYHSAAIGESEAALAQATQALSFLNSTEPSAVLGDVYDAMGWALFSQGDFVEAVAMLLRAMHIAEELGDQALQAHALDKMSSVHGVTGHYQDALDGHLEALAIQLELGDEINVALVRNNLAFTYVAMGNYDLALEAAQESLACIEGKPNLPHAQTAVLDTLANIHREMGELDTAYQYVTRALLISRKHHSVRGQCDNLITLGRIELQRQRYSEALSAVTSALTMAEKYKRSVEEFTCHKLLAEIYERRGDALLALAEYRRFHELEQRRINEESETRIAHLRVEHQLDSARKDSEIHRLRSLALEREVEERRLAQARLEAQASLDPLTGLYNRRHLSVLSEELQAAAVRGEPACLALFDIDHFKLVNDTFGHLTGDRVLVSLALLLGRNSRASDIPCRYGGDEFLVLLVGLDGDTGAEAAERLRASVAAATIESDLKQIKVTISVGVACVQAGDDTDLSELIERADRALYAAKLEGRNRVVVV